MSLERALIIGILAIIFIVILIWALGEFDEESVITLWGRW